MIYLASAYSSPRIPIFRTLEEQFNWRYEEALEALAFVHILGLGITYSPIVHFHTLAQKYVLPKDADFWWKTNEAFLSKSDRLYVLKSMKWEESTGVRREIEYMKAAGKPIHSLVPQFTGAPQIQSYVSGAKIQSYILTSFTD